MSSGDRGAIPLSRPDVSEAEIQAVVSVLRTDRLSLGPRLEAFESAVAARARRKHGIAVNSGTSALHLCVRGLGIGEGDEVITTPFSFVATTNCILYERARPVFADIDIESYNLDPAAVLAAITPRTKAILPAEIFGNTAHFDEYEQIAKEHGLLLIEDSCEALGGCLGDRPAGSFGQCSVFGFYPNKQITTGEGGVLVTDDDDLANTCRSMRSQGKADPSANCYEQIGYNYRMTELSAAIGEQQMKRLDEILERRRQVAHWYLEALGDVEEIHLPPCADLAHASWFVFVIRLADRYGAFDRAAITLALQKAGIGCEHYFSPIHVQPYIRELLGCRQGDFPVTERVADRTIALPFYTAMTQKTVLRVARGLRSVLRACQAGERAAPLRGASRSKAGEQPAGGN
jgi:perosamine synthetase